jgi:hypothetical protein
MDSEHLLEYQESQIAYQGERIRRDHKKAVRIISLRVHHGPLGRTMTQKGIGTASGSAAQSGDKLS